MNLKLLSITILQNCSEEQKGNLCLCLNQKIYENYKAWLAWFFERLELQIVVEHPQLAISLVLFIC